MGSLSVGLARLPAALARFARDEDGAGFAWNIFWSVVFLTLAGLTIDTSHAYRTKRVLVATADSAALAASMGHDRAAIFETVTGKNADGLDPDARGRALAVAMSERIMAPDSNGRVVAPADVRFGSYSREMGFVEGTGFYARVTAVRAARNDNSLQSLMLGRLTLFGAWDVAPRRSRAPPTRPATATASSPPMSSTCRATTASPTASACTASAGSR